MQLFVLRVHIHISVTVVVAALQKFKKLSPRQWQRIFHFDQRSHHDKAVHEVLHIEITILSTKIYNSLNNKLNITTNFKSLRFYPIHNNLYFVLIVLSEVSNDL